MITALAALKRQFADLKAKSMSLKELNQKIIHIAYTGPHKSTSKKLDRLFTTVSISMLGTILEVL